MKCMKKSEPSKEGVLKMSPLIKEKLHPPLELQEIFFLKFHSRPVLGLSYGLNVCLAPLCSPILGF